MNITYLGELANGQYLISPSRRKSPRDGSFGQKVKVVSNSLMLGPAQHSSSMLPLWDGAERMSFLVNNSYSNPDYALVVFLKKLKK